MVRWKGANEASRNRITQGSVANLAEVSTFQHNGALISARREYYSTVDKIMIMAPLLQVEAASKTLPQLCRENGGAEQGCGTPKTSIEVAHHKCRLGW